MKTIYTTLLLLVISITTFAQGIAVQGIARDNTNAAITNETLSFDFRITDTADAVLFRETQQIRTDNFGLFSHVVSTGTAADGTVFNNVDFSQQGLKLIVWINYNSNNVQVYNQPLQYVPYAHFAKKAENGVPPGTVVAFMGDDNKIPDGWVKCTGQNIATGNQYAALRAVIGNTIPDLRARFLRGQGVSSNIGITIYDENTQVRQYLDQTIAGHNHGVNINTNYTGDHSHFVSQFQLNTAGGSEPRDFVVPQSGFVAWKKSYLDRNTSTTGSHNHNVSGNTADVGAIQNGGQTLAVRGEENRPWTVVVNYIIKL
ncbi:tail fiber protein [Polaribacter sp. Hel_I_88]|uniref:tail fiber protein n=1 Tax=Polaribacter sp. Hel_I_88 TaxID=1250006 RepID=UPI00047CEF04|nr:tail fiber protein [Polaribacter sp. Hel_I_88]